MISEARAYLASRSIVRREPLYSANRFARHLGDIPAVEVTTGHLEQLRSALQDSSLAARTIESTIADLITVITATTGTAPKHGKRLQLPRPRPRPVPLAVIEAIWPHMSPETRAWAAFTYWTALRLSDGMRWLLSHKGRAMPDLIDVTASKTGKHLVCPLPGWLATILESGPYRFRTVSDFARRAIRGELHAACVKASVEVVLPKQFRQRGVTEWARVNATAGRIIHGCDLGILDHYIDPLSVLESTAPRVRLPTCFGAQEQDTEQSLLTHFRRLDPSAQQLITGTAERLSAG